MQKYRHYHHHMSQIILTNNMRQICCIDYTVMTYVCLDKSEFSFSCIELPYIQSLICIDTLMYLLWSQTLQQHQQQYNNVYLYVDNFNCNPTYMHLKQNSQAKHS